MTTLYFWLLFINIKINKDIYGGGWFCVLVADLPFFLWGLNQNNYCLSNPNVNNNAALINVTSIQLLYQHTPYCGSKQSTSTQRSYRGQRSHQGQTGQLRVEFTKVKNKSSFFSLNKILKNYEKSPWKITSLTQRDVPITNSWIALLNKLQSNGANLLQLLSLLQKGGWLLLNRDING